MKHTWINDDRAFGMPDISYCKFCNQSLTVYTQNEDCPGERCIQCLSPADCRNNICAEKLPISAQPLIYRLRKRALIRRENQDRKSVQEGRADRIADLLEEAARALEIFKK